MTFLGSQWFWVIFGPIINFQVGQEVSGMVQPFLVFLKFIHGLFNGIWYDHTYMIIPYFYTILGPETIFRLGRKWTGWVKNLWDFLKSPFQWLSNSIWYRHTFCSFLDLVMILVMCWAWRGWERSLFNFPFHELSSSIQ